MGVAVPQGRAGRREERRGRREDSVPPGRGAESSERGVAAAPTRDTGEGEGAAKPPPEAEGRWDVSTVAFTGDKGVRLEKEVSSVLRREAFCRLSLA